MSEDSARAEARLVRLSKFLALLLRHNPERFHLILDGDGFAELTDVMKIIQGLPNFRWVTRTEIESAVALPGRRRYEIVGERIRALYGHTAMRPDYPVVEPPVVLYHGTAPENLPAIRREGLQPMARQFVHLAATPELARSIALRHTGDPVILAVRAREAYVQGVGFYQPIPEVYLCDEVLPVYLDLD